MLALPYPAAVGNGSVTLSVPPLRPPSISLPLAWLSLVLPPSRRGSRSRPIKTLYDHVVPAQRPLPPPLRLSRVLLFLFLRVLFLLVGFPLSLPRALLLRLLYLHILSLLTISLSVASLSLLPLRHFLLLLLLRTLSLLLVAVFRSAGTHERAGSRERLLSGPVVRPTEQWGGGLQ